MKYLNINTQHSFIGTTISKPVFSKASDSLNRGVRKQNPGELQCTVLIINSYQNKKGRFLGCLFFRRCLILCRKINIKSGSFV